MSETRRVPAQIEFENCIFSASEEALPLRHTPSLQWPKTYNKSGKGIKTENVGGIDMIIANISLKKNNGFSIKCWQK